MAAHTAAHHAKQTHGRADQAAAQLIQGQPDAAFRLRQKRSNDQKAHRQDHQRRGHIVLYFGVSFGVYRLAILAEQDPQHPQRHQCAQFHAPEDARTAFHPEKVEEVHLRKTAQQHTGGITHHGGGALQVGGNRNGDQHRHRRDGQPPGNGQAHRCDHQHRSHVVHKSADHAGKQRQHGHCAPHIRHMTDQLFRQAQGHLALNKQRHRAHRAGDHQQHVEVHSGQRLPQRKLIDAHLSHHHKNSRSRQRCQGASLRPGQHRHIGGGKYYQCKNHVVSCSSVPGSSSTKR